MHPFASSDGGKGNLVYCIFANFTAVTSSLLGEGFFVKTPFFLVPWRSRLKLSQSGAYPAFSSRAFPETTFLFAPLFAARFLLARLASERVFQVKTSLLNPALILQCHWGSSVRNGAECLQKVINIPVELFGWV